MKRILVSPLSVGLGHATRVLPIVRHLLGRGHEVTVAGTGRALALLRREAPACEFLQRKDYPNPFSRGRYFVPKFVAMMPALQGAVNAEGRRLRRLLGRRRFDLLLSDSRYGIRSPDVPSLILTHGLRFVEPQGLRRAHDAGHAWLARLEFLTEIHTARVLPRFDRILVPDFADPERCLSGRCCHGLTRLPMNRVYYAGPITSVRRLDVPLDVDVFLSLSGPEPQRTELERIILAQVERLPGSRVVVALGKPEVKEVRRLNSRITVYGYLDRGEQQAMLNRAHLVVCRSGYTTIMELAELGKKALFIPQPGQMEQEYLAEYHRRRGYFHAASQYGLDLAREVEAARATPGFPVRFDTAANVERLYDEVLGPILDGGGPAAP
jgi:UDP-N-acetylglucosamine transferase subunit ALG13